MCASWQNGRRYGPAEYGHRLRVFVGNKRRIDEHNAGNHSFESRSCPCPRPRPPTLSALRWLIKHSSSLLF